MNCRICRDTGRVQASGVMGATVGVGERTCTCPAGDEYRAHDLVMALYDTPGVALAGDATAAERVVLEHLAKYRETLCRIA